MSESFPTPEEWIVAHQEEYYTLFDDNILSSETMERQLLDPLQVGRVALSALARCSDTRKRGSLRLRAETDLIERGVDRILNACQDNNFGIDHNFLGDVNTGHALSTLKFMTSRIISLWQRGCRQYRRESPFAELYAREDDVLLDSVDNKPIKLVLMAAAGLRSVVKQPVITTIRSSGIPPWARDVCLYGPRYARVLLPYWRAIKHPLRLYGSITYKGVREDDFFFDPQDSTYAPENVLFESEDEAYASEMVSFLISAANLTTDQRELLLNFFEEGSQVMSPEIEQLLHELHCVAQENGLV